VHAIVFTSDPALLKLVLGHVIRNALEACTAGQSVTLSAGQSGDHVEFTVRNPAFIPREVQLQIFQRGFSTKGEGRGLGTYTVKVITERCLQGQVSFVSTPNVGTTFKVSYPLVLGAAS
jgi:sensor histidine kinase regulating citrate/malate metabolism